MTGLGGTGSESQMTGKEERWHKWRKKGRAKERVGGTGSCGTVWSKSGAERGSETES